MNIKSKIDESKVKQAEAKIRTEKIRRDAAYDALVRAQKRNAGPNERQRLADIYDRAEDRLQQAEDAAREMKRRAMGLEPKVRLTEEEILMLPAHMAMRLRGA